MRIAIASDHAGFGYKQLIKSTLTDQGHDVEDFGVEFFQSCDYPDFVRPAAEAVASGQCDRGIVIGGSGNGEAMVANKVERIRCALCWDLRSARLSRAHNDANMMLSLGQRMISIDAALEIVELWLGATFEGGRHTRRINKIEKANKLHS